MLHSGCMSEMTHSAYEALRPVQSDWLTKALHYSGKSAEQLADELGVHRNTISRFMNGRGKPPARHMILAWAMATGVPLAYLETGEIPPENGPDGGPGLDSEGRQVSVQKDDSPRENVVQLGRATRPVSVDVAA